jgi:hypothetical protein
MTWTNKEHGHKISKAGGGRRVFTKQKHEIHAFSSMEERGRYVCVCERETRKRRRKETKTMNTRPPKRKVGETSVSCFHFFFPGNRSMSFFQKKRTHQNTQDLFDKHALFFMVDFCYRTLFKRRH